MLTQLKDERLWLTDDRDSLGIFLYSVFYTKYTILLKMYPN